MKNIKRTIRINASPNAVYSFVAEPTNLPEVWPSMLEVSNLKRNADGSAQSFDWVYKMAGVRFNGHSETLKREANKLVELESKSGITNHMVWNYDAKDGGCDLTLDLQYDVPIPLLGRLAESFLVKLNEREIDIMLQNLRERLESGAVVQPEAAKGEEKRV